MDEQRYRNAEARLWDTVGVDPVEQRLDLARNGVTVRVQEVGEGPPMLFIHGGPGASGTAWATLAAQLTDHRCLLLDRPGTGLSGPSRLTDAAAVRHEAETLVVDVLDELGIDRAHVVGSSHGSYVAMLSAAAHPDRIGRSVHLGSPGFLEGMTLRIADRLILLPGAARLFAKAKPSEKALTKVLRQLGHGPTLDAGKIPPALMDWFLALHAHTDTMANEFASMAAMGTFLGGFDPRLSVDRATLETIESETVFLWGTNEVYGDAEVARRTVEAMPHARLEMLPDAGHLCWLDDLDRAVALVRGHLLHAKPSPVDDTAV